MAKCGKNNGQNRALTVSISTFVEHFIASVMFTGATPMGGAVVVGGAAGTKKSVQKKLRNKQKCTVVLWLSLMMSPAFFPSFSTDKAVLIPCSSRPKLAIQLRYLWIYSVQHLPRPAPCLYPNLLIMFAATPSPFEVALPKDGKNAGGGMTVEEGGDDS